jgi:phosphoglycolate phosphatase-like HAD superfamily hydrolase
MPRALLLDIDGTLVDNTAQHIAAWREALQAQGLTLDEETLRANIGKGGDLFVRAVAGEDWDREHGEACRRLHSQGYKRRMPEVRPVADVGRFLEAARRRGLVLALASSSNPDEVGANLAVIGEKPENFPVVVDKDDIETSKPAPDAFAVALERSRVSAGSAVAVGDTRWDGEAAAKLRAPFWGVLTGAGREAELRSAGATVVSATLAGLIPLLDG